MKRLFTILLLLSAVCFAGQYVLAGDPPPTGSGTGSSGTGSGSGNGGSNGGSNGGDSLVDITIGGNQTPGGGGFGAAVRAAWMRDASRRSTICRQSR